MPRTQGITVWRSWKGQLMENLWHKAKEVAGPESTWSRELQLCRVEQSPDGRPLCGPLGQEAGHGASLPGVQLGLGSPAVGSPACQTPGFRVLAAQAQVLVENGMMRKPSWSFQVITALSVVPDCPPRPMDHHFSGSPPAPAQAYPHWGQRHTTQDPEVAAALWHQADIMERRLHFKEQDAIWYQEAWQDFMAAFNQVATTFEELVAWLPPPPMSSVMPSLLPCLIFCLPPCLMSCLPPYPPAPHPPHLFILPASPGTPAEWRDRPPKHGMGCALPPPPWNDGPMSGLPTSPRVYGCPHPIYSYV
ncbi:uncharacterized protein LOC142025045 [Carettochelys insculpta]|uniref:uncharacterized protein LOC142025045 n=1 Tax=Carettochelys insculpta TaxID=44489 RepID=UPI003EB885B3